MAVTLIAHTEVGSGGATEINFSSIPSSYDDLWLLISARFTTASTYITALRVEINGSTAVEYSSTRITGNGSSAASARFSSRTNLLGSIEPASTATANTFGNTSFYLPNYKNTTNFKQAISDFAAENNDSTNYYVGGYANLWSNTSAVSSLRLFEISGGSFVQYSTATLYGVTKA